MKTYPFPAVTTPSVTDDQYVPVRKTGTKVTYIIGTPPIMSFARFEEINEGKQVSQEAYTHALTVIDRIHQNLLLQEPAEGDLIEIVGIFGGGLFDFGVIKHVYNQKLLIHLKPEQPLFLSLFDDGIYMLETASTLTQQWPTIALMSHVAFGGKVEAQQFFIKGDYRSEAQVRAWRFAKQSVGYN